MPSVSWPEALERAPNEQELLSVVRDYVASLDAYELAALPACCRPGKFFDAHDVTAFAFEVVRYQCEEAQPTRELVHKIAAFFSQASTRLSRILARAPEDDPEHVRSA